MTDSSTPGLMGTWAPAESPFKIAYSFRALDDIRLAVIDAFFSLPRGGAEIGGILLGKREADQISVLNYVALDCEHAFGPSFNLSPRDLAHLSLLIDAARKNTPDLQPIGWYHSHTRSEIFLSESDLEIHKRYFSAPWHVALVMKPHTFQPTRAGFFVRNADGSFHTESSYFEFVLDPLPIQPLPAGIPAGLPPPPTLPPLVPVPSGTNGHSLSLDEPPVSEPKPPDVIASSAPVESGLASIPEPAIAVDEVPIHFPDLEARPRWRATPILVLAVILAIGALGYETRQLWLPHIWNGASAASQSPVATSLGLAFADQDGQLRIAWDQKLPAVQAASRGILEISADGGLPVTTQLDTQQLQSGSFSYKRETEKVEVILSVDGPNGELGRETLTFLGKLTDPHAAPPGSSLAKQRDALAVEVEALRSDLKAERNRTQQLQKAADQRGNATGDVERLKGQLAAQIAHSKDMEKAAKSKDDQIAKLRNDLSVQTSHNKVLSDSLDTARNQLKLQQKKRLANQAADTAK